MTFPNGLGRFVVVVVEGFGSTGRRDVGEGVVGMIVFALAIVVVVLALALILSAALGAVAVVVVIGSSNAVFGVVVAVVGKSGSDLEVVRLSSRFRRRSHGNSCFVSHRNRQSESEMEVIFELEGMNE